MKAVDHRYITSGASTVASFPGLHDAFGCTNECEGPGMFSHLRDVEGRKVVERT